MPTREPRLSAGSMVRNARLWAGAAALALVVAATWLLGGWERSAPGGPVTAAPGAEVEAAPFRVRLDEASARYTAAGDDAEPEQAFVVVEGQLELTAPESVGVGTVLDVFRADLADSFDFYGEPTDVAEASVRVLPDESSLNGVGPGLRYDVQLVFVVAEQSVPDQVTVSVRGHTQRLNAIDFQLGWYDAAPVARVTLDVAPLPATRPESETF